MIRGGFRGGGRFPPPLRDSTPCRPKGSPFDTFSEIHFWPTDPKFFLKAPSAPIYTNFEGERAPKKTLFFCQHFSKSAQKRLFLTVFSKFACGAENFAKIGAKQCFGRARKINLVDLKKRVVKILENFLKFRPPPPLEKILDPLLVMIRINHFKNINDSVMNRYRNSTSVYCPDSVNDQCNRGICPVLLQNCSYTVALWKQY